MLVNIDMLEHYILIGNIIANINVYTLQPLHEYLHGHDVYRILQYQNDDVCVQN